MKIKIHPHAKERMFERGAAEEEIIATIKNGESFLARHDRVGFRRNFIFNDYWNKKYYKNKQLEVISKKENDDWLVLTVIVKYF